MTEPYNKIKQLVKHFREQESAYLSPGYQESQVRQDFIDKFFTALGWDVTHELQKNPYEQEVKIENKVNTTGSQRRADYAFFIAPNFRDVKFFVEAKKPSRSLSNQNDYYQTIRYGWNSKTHIAVLTDFEELHILDCRFKPDIKTALDRKLEIFHYSDYEDEEKFKQIFYLLSRNEVANGSIEKYSATLPKPRGKGAKQGMFKTEYKAVDEAFLESLDGYREQLARAFKNKNQKLEGEELTEAVQRTIDRLVFIRFLEDKSIEEPSIAAIKDKADVWKAFVGLCKRLEPKYNGLVFKPHRIIDGQDFIPPDDKMFAEICDELANPTSPYDFDKIPISILGSIYERFLGKVVSATEKRAKVIEKPEVRKAGGVYYTPEYIVRYIVNETVGKLLSDEQKVIANEVKQSNSSPTNEIASVVPQAELPRNDSTVSKLKLSPKQVEDLKIIDIACGSGSFLIEVYSQLLDYHTKYYNEFPEKAKKGDVETREGKTVLSLKKRQEILVNNIYGVDIDFQATEVTQLSLYLKLLEDVTMNDAFQYSLLKEKILPDLKSNIVCGNSLIGRDILEGKLFDDETEHTLKPMNFEDVFPDIMKRGGFDVVVGNPPYIKIQNATENYPLLAEELKKKYDSAKYGNYDMYVVFVEKCLRITNKYGIIGYILPHKFFNSGYGQGLRQLISENGNIHKIIHFGDHQIFKGATTYTCLLFLTKKRNQYFQVAKLDEALIPVKFLIAPSFKTKRNEDWGNNDWLIQDDESKNILNRFNNLPLLRDVTSNIFQGPKAGADDVFILEKIRDKNTTIVCHSYSLAKEVEIEKAVIRDYIKSKFMRRYLINDKARQVTIFPYDESFKLISENKLIEQFPKAWSYLDELTNKKILQKRENGRFAKQWWCYSRPQNMAILNSIKILTPFNAFEASFVLDLKGDFVFSAGVSGAYGIILKPTIKFRIEYLLGLLNSRFLFFVLRNISTSLRGSFWSFENKYLQQLPIRTINFEDVADKARHDNIVKLVEKMLDAKAKTANAKTESETNRFEMICKTLDRQIDEAVYELYGLSEEEIKIVEGI